MLLLFLLSYLHGYIEIYHIYDKKSTSELRFCLWELQKIYKRLNFISIIYSVLHFFRTIIPIYKSRFLFITLINNLT